MVIEESAAFVEAVLGHEFCDLQGTFITIDVGQGDFSLPFRRARRGGVLEHSVGQDRDLRVQIDRCTDGLVFRRGHDFGILGKLGTRFGRQGDAVMAGMNDEFLYSNGEGMSALGFGDYTRGSSHSTGRIALAAVFGAPRRRWFQKFEMRLRELRRP